MHMEKNKCFCFGSEKPNIKEVNGRTWCETCGFIFNRIK